MPTLAGIAVAVQVCFAVHVIKTGRPYWWILVIMVMPVLGCLLYYFIEVFPRSQAYLEAHQDAQAPTIEPDAEIKRLIAELAVCGSVAKHIALAEEYSRRQMHAEAEQLYAKCMMGVFAADAAVLLGLARAAVNNRNWDKAGEAIARLRQAAPKMRPHEVAFLEARVLEAQGVSCALARS